MQVEIVNQIVASGADRLLLAQELALLTAIIQQSKSVESFKREFIGGDFEAFSFLHLCKVGLDEEETELRVYQLFGKNPSVLIMKSIADGQGE
jgi:hypothetical protein